VKSLRLFIILVLVFAFFAVMPKRPAVAQGVRTPPGKGYHKVAPPSWYGSIVMKNNTAADAGVAPVVFTHWTHRRYYTCNVCHTDLGFAWKAGQTTVTQADIETGKKCGACHNGEDVFGADKCLRCHSYGKEVPENSRFEFAMKDMPPDDFGNKINWVRALHDKKIKPVASVDGTGKLKALDKDIVIPSSRFAPGPPDVLFPHKSHTEVLDCKSCHPGRFKPKKGGNLGMDMMKIIKGEYCGACHGKVAFPLEDCYRCHSQEVKVPDWITGEDVKKEKAEKERLKKLEEEKKKKEKNKKKKKRKFLF